jgi:hypothetical protein
MFIVICSWIMDYFYLADKDESGTLTKKECHGLIKDLLNAKISNDVFEIFFGVLNCFVFFS